MDFCLNHDIMLFLFTLDPLRPCPIMKNQCNLSPDNLYLKWEKWSTSFVNHYKVTIDKKTQITTGYEPEIRWNSLLMSEHEYEVTIIALSYGYTTNYPTYGTKESAPYVFKIKTIRCKFIFISSICDELITEIDFRILSTKYIFFQKVILLRNWSIIMINPNNILPCWTICTLHICLCKLSSLKK